MYDNLWLDHDETDNFAQKHDVGIAKSLVRPNVEDEAHGRDVNHSAEKIKMQLDKAEKEGKEREEGEEGKKERKGRRERRKERKKERTRPGSPQATRSRK